LALLTAALAEQNAGAAIPRLLIDTILRATKSNAIAATCTVSATAVAVADEIVTTMTLVKIKASAAVILFGALVIGAGWAARSTPDEPPLKAVRAHPAVADALPDGAIARLGSSQLTVGS